MNADVAAAVKKNRTPVIARPGPSIASLAADFGVVAATMGANDGPQDSEMTFRAFT